MVIVEWHQFWYDIWRLYICRYSISDEMNTWMIFTLVDVHIADRLEWLASRFVLLDWLSWI